MYSRSMYNTVFVGVHHCIVVGTKKILATAYVLCLVYVYTRVYLRLYAMGDAITYECSTEFVVRGHHVYKAIWNPVIGEVLVCDQETDNDEDSYAVAVKIEDTIVGYVPREISRIRWYF